MMMVWITVCAVGRSCNCSVDYRLDYWRRLAKLFKPWSRIILSLQRQLWIAMSYASRCAETDWECLSFPWRGIE
jgi:hypothetical protein